MDITIRKIPPLNALRAFEIAARHLSFNAAANELCVTPAAISHQIKSLEDFLGQPLFKRVKRRVILTEQGQLILPEIKQAFSLIDKAMDNLARHKESELLTISASPAFTAKWLIPRIHLFKKQYPDIDVRLDANQEVFEFDTDKADVAIRFGNGEYPGLKSIPLQPLAKEKIFPVCSPDLQHGEMPLNTPEDLQHHTLLHDEAASATNTVPDWRKWLKAAGADSFNPDRGIRFNNSVLAIDAAINGQGVALGCSFVVADDLKSGRLIKPFTIPCDLNFNYYVVYPREKCTGSVDKFCHWLNEMCEVEQAKQARE